MYRHDARNSGYNPSATVPRDVDVRWRYAACSEAKSGVVVADGRVHAGEAILDGSDGTRTAGEFHSYQRPAVVDDALYVGSHTLDAYDAADGTHRWNFEPDGMAGAVSPPTVRDGTVFIAGNLDDPTIYAVDASDGTERWRFTADQTTFDTAPATDGDRVYAVGQEGGIYALDTETGTERWRYDGTSVRRRDPVTVADETVYAPSVDGDVIALDAEDGTERWRHVPDRTNGVTVAVADGTVFVSGERCLALVASDGTVRWEATDAGGHTCSVAQETVLLGGKYDGTLVALDRADGTKRWEFETRSVLFSDYENGGIPVAPTAVNGLVFVATSAGDAYALGRPD